ncbi:MAG: DUF2238 domain-containing protein [Ruminococcaceae bacterium]|nr:DUF2238 domain-containing protein [Oscillospiraceae bacterium]
MIVLFLCILAIFAGVLVNAKFRVFTFKTCIAFSLLLILSVFCGRTLNFYATVPYWDKVLHFESGFIFARAGKELYLRLGGSLEKKWLSLCFSLFAAISAAAIWEIWEFAGDSLFGLTSQNNSLQDTMLDIILGSVSGAIYSLFLLF